MIDLNLLIFVKVESYNVVGSLSWKFGDTVTWFKKNKFADL